MQRMCVTERLLGRLPTKKAKFGKKQRLVDNVYILNNIIQEELEVKVCVSVSHLWTLKQHW